MRFIRPFAVAVVLCISHPAFAQEWTRFVSPEDGFSANFPGRPKVETTTYLSEYRQSLPAKVYTADDALGRYSTTVVDYRGIEQMHTDRAAKCLAAKGANQRDGDTCQNDFRVDVAGATDHAVWNFMKRRRRDDDALHVLLRRAGVRPPASDDEPGPDTHLRGDPSTRWTSLYPSGNRALRHARADSVHAVAGLGRRPRDSRFAIARSTPKATASGSFRTSRRRSQSAI